MGRQCGKPSSPQFPGQSPNLARSSAAWRTDLVIKGMLQILVVCEDTLVLFMKPPQGSKQVICPTCIAYGVDSGVEPWSPYSAGEFSTSGDSGLFRCCLSMQLSDSTFTPAADNRLVSACRFCGVSGLHIPSAPGTPPVIWRQQGKSTGECDWLMCSRQLSKAMESNAL